MNCRQNTIVCSFDRQCPRLSAHDIHNWLADTLTITTADLFLVQIDGAQRQVYVKFREYETMHRILTSFRGGATVRHSNGEISTAHIESAGMGTKRVRLSNLPPELPAHVIQQALSKYGDVRQIASEMWNQTYRLTVDSGVRFATVTLTTHIPSHIYINGYRALVSYDTQPLTCYKCNETGHMYTDCPKKKSITARRIGDNTASWAGIVAGETPSTSTTPSHQSDTEMMLNTTQFPPLSSPVLPSARENNTERESPTALSAQPQAAEEKEGKSDTERESPTALSAQPQAEEEKEGNSDDARPSEVPSPTAVPKVDELTSLYVNKETVQPTPPHARQPGLLITSDVTASPPLTVKTPRTKHEGRPKWSEDDVDMSTQPDDQNHSPKRQKKLHLQHASDTVTRHNRNRSRSASRRS
jgi:hypothetical protein